MPRSLRTLGLVAAGLVAVLAALSAVPASAQFSNPFEALFGGPPRPPGAVPGGRPVSAAAALIRYAPPGGTASPGFRIGTKVTWVRRPKSLPAGGPPGALSGEGFCSIP